MPERRLRQVMGMTVQEYPRTMVFQRQFHGQIEMRREERPAAIDDAFAAVGFERVGEIVERDVGTACAGTSSPCD